MSYLLDTNVPSEFSRARPERLVEQWFQAQPKDALFISAITIGEIRKGITLLPTGRRRIELENWFRSDLLTWFRHRALPLTQAIAELWGDMDGRCQLHGVSLTTTDGLIAATALEHSLILVTRNVKDFAGLGVSIMNPWAAA